MTAAQSSRIGDSFHLTPAIAEQIREQSYAGLKALRRRGLEIGGFLAAVPESGGCATVLHLVKSEYLSGPQFTPSPADLLAFRAQIVEAQSLGKRPLAYFRSNLRDTMELAPADIAAVGYVLADVRFILLARPRQDGTVNFGLFRRNAPNSWLGPEDPADLIASSTSAEVLDLPKVVPAESVTVVAANRNSRRFRLLIPIMICVLSLVFLAGLGRLLWVGHGRVIDLHLRARPEGTGLQLTWDRGVAKRGNFSAAKLTITDGGTVREVSMDATELAAGQSTIRQIRAMFRSVFNWVRMKVRDL